MTAFEFPSRAGDGPFRRFWLLCHLLRWLSIAWAAWSLVHIVTHWNDADAIAKGYGRLLGRDLSALPALHHQLGYIILLADWVFVVAVVYCIWDLFGHFLAGRIFDRSAVAGMRRLAWAAVAAIAADVIARPLLAAVLTLHQGPAGLSLKVWTVHNDLLHALMALFFVVLANVFAVGLTLAEDNRQIV